MTEVFLLYSILSSLNRHFTILCQLISAMLQKFTLPSQDLSISNSLHWAGLFKVSVTKLTQDKSEFWFEFCKFAMRFSFYNVWPSVLSLNNLKYDKTSENLNYILYSSSWVSIHWLSSNCVLDTSSFSSWNCYSLFQELKITIMLVSFFSLCQQFPFAPMPPPPAPVTNTDVSHDSDALASMLMAWYLSGYHTGYYQVSYDNLQKLHAVA